MSKIAGYATAATLIVLAAMSAPRLAFAGGQAPEERICSDAQALTDRDAATQGGCIAVDRRKGNCNACHLIAGAPSGDIAPPLAFIAQRFPDKVKLRRQIEDARRANPGTVMPPFGTHHILTPEEIDKVVEFLLTL